MGLIPVIAIASACALTCLVLSLRTLYSFSFFFVCGSVNKKTRSCEPGLTSYELQCSTSTYTTVLWGMDIPLPFQKIQDFDRPGNPGLCAGCPGCPRCPVSRSRKPLPGATDWRPKTKNPAIACGACVLSLCSSIY